MTLRDKRVWKAQAIVHAYDTKKLLQALCGFATAIQALAVANAQHVGVMLGQSEHNGLLENLNSVVKELKTLHCGMSIKSADHSLDLIRRAQPSTTSADNAAKPVFKYSPSLYDSLERQLEDMRRRIVDEVSEIYFFRMTDIEAVFYDSSSPLFGEDVNSKFPSSAEEIIEARKCRALGRWTACVIHLMRALEPALKALQEAVGVDVPKEQWNQIIDQIDKDSRN